MIPRQRGGPRVTKAGACTAWRPSAEGRRPCWAGPSGAARDCVMPLRNAHLKTRELLVSGIFHVMFSDRGRPWVTGAVNKGHLLPFQPHPGFSTWVFTVLPFLGRVATRLRGVTLWAERRGFLLGSPLQNKETSLRTPLPADCPLGLIAPHGVV